MTIQELSDEMRKERARCSTHCGTWNREDRDCEIYGEQHCPPSKCRYFLATELARRNKEIEKMKDEELAEEYVFSNPPSVVIDNHSYFLPSDLKRAFLAGLKAGRPQWHTDPNDLPERMATRSKTVINQIGTPCHYNYDLGHWENWSYIPIETPIAWCEIPTFDKE